MDRRDAILLVRNLLQRIDYKSGDGPYTLVLSADDVGAIKSIATHVGEPETPSLSREDRASGNENFAVVAEEQIPLNTFSLHAQSDANPLLCIDFGTGFSKAFATSSFDDQLIDIELGRIAGGQKGEFPVVSSVYVTEGKIWFGPDAIRKSEAEADSDRERFDSPKQWISQGSFETLGNEKVGKKTNPTNTTFTKRDFILLYLAYLTLLISEGLEEHHIGRYARRRFARPAWGKDLSAWAEREMRSMLIQAQIIADTIPSQLKSGLPVSIARRIVDKVLECDTTSATFIGESVLEATAAGASALRTDSAGRHIFVVVDVGAGTIDFAAFFGIEDKEGNVKIRELRGSRQVLRQAGDTLDRYLVEELLRRAHVDRSSDEGQRVLSHLQKKQRDIKLSLFRDHFIEVTLSNDFRVSIRLDEFLNHDPVKRFSVEVEKKFDECLSPLTKETIKAFHHRALVILTGGGASLPMIQSIAERKLTVKGSDINCEPVTPQIPEWISIKYPGLAPIFPQLAVAIGGSAKELPIEDSPVGPIFAEPSDPRWYIEPSYKI